MNERNCGFCRPCARGEYDKCETRAMLNPEPPTVVYVLYSFDRWAREYDDPWDIRGFMYSEEESKKWVADGDGLRKYEIVSHMEVKI